MKKVLLIMIVVTGVAEYSLAQDKIFTKTGIISFDATASLDEVEAINKKATCIVNTTTGQMEFALLLKAFEFEKALMEEHFNENYVESDKFPKSIFKGKINDMNQVSFAKDGTYSVTISGDLTMHGVTKAVTANGSFIVKGGIVKGTSVFTILLSDYDISIPSVVKETVSNKVTIKVDVILEPFAQNN